MAKDTRKHLIESGMQHFLKKGFNHTGIQEVLQAVQVPKGSFYHFFKSKQDFGMEVLDQYSQQSLVIARELLQKEDQSPLQRLRNFFSDCCRKSAETGFSGGCLVGNLSQELADQSPAFALRLEESWNELQQLIAGTIREAQQQSQIKIGLPADQLAGFLLNGWQGTLMRSKLTKTCRHQEDFLTMVFDQLLV